MPTQAAWIPLAHCGDLPSLNETVDRLIECADNLLERVPWLAALAYSLGLPYKEYSVENLPDSALEWDMKAHSRQHFFHNNWSGVGSWQCCLVMHAIGLHVPLGSVST